MSKKKVHAYAALGANRPLEPFQYELPEIGPDQVDIRVQYCGVCHSDLNMLNNDWGMTTYPIVPGHEVVGTVVETGNRVRGIEAGDAVGLGWFSSSCMSCDQCISGSHHLCGGGEQTIVGRNGGFADLVRCHWAWAIPIGKKLDPSKIGPLFCGGITVFNPILVAGVQPTDRVGVIGIGGLGHLAVQFLNKWGCEVTAFTSSPDKREEARRLGAHNVIDSGDESALDGISGTLDFVLNTTYVNLDWQKYLGTLGPKGALHTVGAVVEPMLIPAFSLIMGEKSVSGSSLGSPALNRKMLEFCERHSIAPVTEEFSLEEANDALAHLRSGKARYRVVLKV